MNIGMSAWLAHGRAVEKDAVRRNEDSATLLAQEHWVTASASREASWRELMTRRRLVAALVLAIGYFGGVLVGLALTYPPNPISLLWPANAILLAALLLSPPRTWWLSIAAVFPAHLLAEALLGMPLTMSLCWYLSNVAEALLGAAVIWKYVGGTPRFDRVRDLSIFLLAAVLAAPLLSSFLAAGFVALVGWRYDDYWHIWRMRVFSNSLATLTLVPVTVNLMSMQFRSWRSKAFLEHAEFGVLLAGTFIVSYFAFQQDHAPATSAMLMYAPLPLLVWAAVRQSVITVSLCVVIVAFVAVVGVSDGRGPFIAGSPEDAALAVQSFLIIAAASLMLLAASLAELRETKVTAQNQEESLNLALGAARIGIWEWDIHSDRVRWRVASSAAMKSASRGVCCAELLARVHQDDRDSVRRAIDAALRKADIGEIEYRLVMPSGDVQWVTSRGRLIIDAHGEPQRMIGVYVDTTERKLQELQVRAHREQLAYLSRISLMGELSGALAHELNQPLAAILLNAQAASFAMDQPTPNLDEIHQILMDIIADDRRAGEVIRRLRALFLRGVVQTRPVAVNDCIREVLVLEHSYLIARQVATELHLADGLSVVLADWVQLQQVLLNLILNACDAMAGNQPSDRRLRIDSRLARKDEIEIRISDNGRGVDDVEAMFEPFISSKDNGIGLGLAVSRTIISAHRGRLWASRNAVRGLTLHVALPAVSEASRDEEPSSVHASNLESRH